MTASRHLIRPRFRWTPARIAMMRERYPSTKTEVIARRLGCALHVVYAKAAKLGLKKSAAYLASPDASHFRRGDHVGAAFWFPKGHVPANKGLRRPGWHCGRMRETQFRKGQRSKRWDPEAYGIGALRVNTDGYIDMKVREAPGALAWRQLHLILWEDVHGPVPRGYCLRFKDGDRLNVELDNLECISRAELMRRNTIHNLPAPLKSAIQLLGKLKRRIREKQNRGPSQSPVRDARGSARSGKTDGSRASKDRGCGGAGARRLGQG